MAPLFVADLLSGILRLVHLMPIKRHDRIQFSRDWLSDFCRANRIARLSLFGSVLRDDFHEGSDVDMLVEYESGAPVDYFDMMRMQRELSEELGMQVDLRTPAELSKYFRQRVMEEAEVCYVHR